MPTGLFPRSLALLLAVASGAAAAQTVCLEPARIDGNPLFTRYATFSGVFLVDGPPARATLPVRLDDVRHVLIGLDGTTDTLVVAVGRKAMGAWQIFAGAPGAMLRPTDAPMLAAGESAGTVRAATLAAADGSVSTFGLEASYDHNFLFFRHLDARTGMADFDGTPRVVALVLSARSGVYTVGDDLVVFVDGNGDGVLDAGEAESERGTHEAHEYSDPFRLGDRRFRLASVAADGSEATFEAVPDDAEALVVGFRMPDLALERLDGTPMHLSDFRGKTVVINWWADFCHPCYAEMPGLTALAADHADDPTVAFVAIARNTRAELEAALVGHTFGYQQTTADEGAEALMGQAFPRHVILDAAGRVRFDAIGGSDNVGETLGAALALILAVAPAAE